MGYPPDFFDFIVIDECHRGGAKDESTWREILEYFSSAVQLDLTATPKRENNADTYAYFGEPVDDTENEPTAPQRPQKIVIKLADGKERTIQNTMQTSFWSPEGKPIAATDSLPYSTFQWVFIGYSLSEN